MVRTGIVNILTEYNNNINIRILVLIIIINQLRMLITTFFVLFLFLALLKFYGPCTEYL